MVLQNPTSRRRWPGPRPATRRFVSSARRRRPCRTLEPADSSRLPRLPGDRDLGRALRRLPLGGAQPELREEGEEEPFLLRIQAPPQLLNETGDERQLRLESFRPRGGQLCPALSLVFRVTRSAHPPPPPH